MNIDRDSIKFVLFVIVSVALVLFSIYKVGQWTFTEKQQVTGKISRLYWSRYIYENEDYREYKCTTITYDDEDTKDWDETFISCGWTTYTNTTNTWSTNGEYPDKPQWPSYPDPIEGRYNTRAEHYCLDIATEIGNYTHCTSYEGYSILKVNQRLILHLNHFNNIIAIEYGE